MTEPIEISSLFNNLEERVDLFICSSSFEERCLEIPEVVSQKLHPRESIIFYNGNESDKIIKNANVLNEKLDSSRLVELNTEEQVKNALEISKKLHEVLESNIKTVLLETSTFTHETLLVVFKLLYFQRGKFEHLYISYISAEEYSTNESIENKWLSSGISDIRTVIGYPGVMSPARKNHLVVLFGFESDRTRELIEDLQFDTISLGFGAENESIDSKHYELNQLRHKKMMKYYRNAHEFEVSLIDPVKTKSDIETHLKNFSDSNTVIAPMNNKISTIGAALACNENPKIQLIYAKAINYNVDGYSKPKDHGYLFNVF